MSTADNANNTSPDPIEQIDDAIEFAQGIAAALAGLEVLDEGEWRGVKHLQQVHIGKLEELARSFRGGEANP